MMSPPSVKLGFLPQSFLNGFNHPVVEGEVGAKKVAASSFMQ